MSNLRQRSWEGIGRHTMRLRIHHPRWPNRYGMLGAGPHDDGEEGEKVLLLRLLWFHREAHILLKSSVHLFKLLVTAPAGRPISSFANISRTSDAGGTRGSTNIGTIEIIYTTMYIRDFRLLTDVGLPLSHIGF